jgi:hypothetical protein
LALIKSWGLKTSSAVLLFEFSVSSLEGALLFCFIWLYINKFFSSFQCSSTPGAQLPIASLGPNKLLFSYLIALVNSSINL